ARELFKKSELAKKYNVVKINTIVIPPGLWRQYIEGGKADIAWGGGPTLFDYLYHEGLLAPLTSREVLEAIAQIPDEIAGMPMKRVGKDGKVYWVAAAIASFGFTVNHERLKDYNLPVPRSWRELASPIIGRPLVEYGEPALGIADPTMSTSNTRMYEIILQRYGWTEGWKILTLMAANAEVYSGSEAVRDGVIRGEIAVGITIDFYGYTAKLVNPECEYIIPRGETIVNGDPIALVKGARNPEAAQAFIAWVLTEGQKVWLDPSINRMPSNPKIFETPLGKNRTDLYEAYKITLKTKGMLFNDTLALMYERVMQWYFKATLVEVNDRLKEVWTKLLSLYFKGKIGESKFNEYVSILCAPLKFTDPLTRKEVEFTEEYAISICEKFEKDPTFKDKLISTWKKEAIEKYTYVLKQLEEY
ncbi:MAG: ABC transporter substrate-binding protein, partial [Thermoprotei archaeon]